MLWHAVIGNLGVMGREWCLCLCWSYLMVVEVMASVVGVSGGGGVDRECVVGVVLMGLSVLAVMAGVW